MLVQLAHRPLYKQHGICFLLIWDINYIPLQLRLGVTVNKMETGRVREQFLLLSHVLNYGYISSFLELLPVVFRTPDHVSYSVHFI